MLEENTLCKHAQKDWDEYTPQDTPVILITVSNFWCIDIIDEIVEFFWAPEYRKVLDNVNSQLILEYAQESFMPFLHLHVLAKLLNIHWQRILFVSGCFNIENLYSNWIKSEHHERSWWQEKIRVAYTSFWQTDLIKPFTGLAIENPDLQNRFYCLNSRLHSHRVFTFMQLYEHELISRGKISMPRDIEIKRWENDVAFRYVFRTVWQDNLWRYPEYQNLEKNLDTIEQLLPLVADDIDTATDPRCINILSPLFRNIPIAMVTETHCDKSQAVFPTEKTWKCILYGQIFIPVSTQNFLHYLSNLGFKTFENHYSDSFKIRFDCIPNHYDRITAAVKLLRSMCELPQEKFQEFIEKCKPDVIHNYNLLNTNVFAICSENIKKKIEDFNGPT